MIKRILGFIALALNMTLAHAGITDGKFSTAQIWDVQYSWSGTTLNASGFNNLFASINYATQTTSAARLTDAQIADAGSNGRYFAFFNSTTNPGTYGLGLYESDGTLYKIINNTGTFTALGNGAIFYLGNGAWGTVITVEGGYSKGGSASFTNMDKTVTADDLTNYTYTNTTPLAAGQTAGGGAPTVVGTAPGTPIVTTSSSTGAATVTTGVVTTASETETEQTVTATTTVTTTTPTTTTTCTTPTTVTTYSDNTTTTTNGAQSCSSATTYASTSNSTAQSQTGRIDQMAKLSAVNQALNAGLNQTAFRTDAVKMENGNFFFKGVGYQGNLSDSYENRSSGFVIGADKNIKTNWRIGVQGAQIKTDLTGIDSTTTVNKNFVGVYNIYELDNGSIIVNNLGLSTNDIVNTRTVGTDYTNSFSVKTADAWLYNRIYGPAIRDMFRIYAGANNGTTRQNAYTESGSVVTARSVGKNDLENNYAEIGIRFAKNNERVIFSVEVGRDTTKTNTASLNLIYKVKDNGYVTVSAASQQNDTVKLSSVGINFNYRF